MRGRFLNSDEEHPEPEAESGVFECETCGFRVEVPDVQAMPDICPGCKAE
jgi:rubrerythrin